MGIWQSMKWVGLATLGAAALGCSDKSSSNSPDAGGSGLVIKTSSNDAWYWQKRSGSEINSDLATPDPIQATGVRTTVTRTENELFATATIPSGIVPGGDVVSLWFLVYDQPQNCTSPWPSGKARCGIPDSFGMAQDVKILRGVHAIVPSDGSTLEMAAMIAKGENGNIPDQSPGIPPFTVGLENPMTADVQVLIRHHAKLVKTSTGVVAQMTTFNGGCTNDTTATLSNGFWCPSLMLSPHDAPNAMAPTGATTRSVHDIYQWDGNGDGVPDAEVATPDLAQIAGSHSTLLRRADQAELGQQITNLTPGHVYSFAWVVFNQPDQCKSPSPRNGLARCGTQKDLATPGASAKLVPAGGAVAGKNGVITLASLQLKSTTLEPSSADVHLVGYDHGPAATDQAMLRQQMTTTTAGCSGECPRISFSIQQNSAP